MWDDVTIVHKHNYVENAHMVFGYICGGL